MERCAGMLGQCGPVAVEADKEGDESPDSFASLACAGGTGLSDSEKTKALANSLDAQYRPVNDPSSSAVIEVPNEAMRVYGYAPSSEPKLTCPSEVLEAIKGLNVGKAPGPNRALRHLPKRATFITKLFNALVRRQYIPPA
jgi:hypothetical protein